MQPYLSIVATSRNDDHGGNLVGRMQAFADNIGVLAERYKAPVELIVVEWNPKEGKPKLAEVVKWPANEYVTTRIIEVPHEVHSTLEHSAKLPLYQMIGKNVGIRRAQADFILCTNVDVLFPPEFFQLVAEKNLKPGIMYRTDRYDVDKSVTDLDSADAQLDFCPKGLVALQRRMCIVVLKEKSNKSPAALAVAGFTADSILTARRSWAVVRLSARRKRNTRQLHHHFYRVLNALRIPGPLPNLHLNACGDFQLMHRDDWDKIQGYWEFDGYSMHLDSCTGYASYAAGIKELVLPFPVYHIDHSGGWTIQTDEDGSFDSKLKERGLTYINLDEIEEKLIRGPKGKAVYSNPKTWGYSDLTLPEQVISPA